jgi:rubredoxin
MVPAIMSQPFAFGGDTENGIPAGTPFEDLPEDWHCPRCMQGKENFNPA